MRIDVSNYIPKEIDAVLRKEDVIKAYEDLAFGNRLYIVLYILDKITDRDITVAKEWLKKGWYGHPMAYNDTINIAKRLRYIADKLDYKTEVYNQILWERNVALQQLRDIGCELGRDMSDIKALLDRENDDLK